MVFTIAYFNSAVKAGVEDGPTRYGRVTLRCADFANAGTRAKSGNAAHSRAGWGLFEIRAKGSEGIGRAFYCARIGQRIVILHQFIKKSQKTPAREIRIARARLKEIDA